MGTWDGFALYCLGECEAKFLCWGVWGLGEAQSK